MARLENYFLGLILCVLSLGGFSSRASQLSEKGDQAAKEAFRNLHFAVEGRGMILSPGLLEQLEFFLPGVSAQSNTPEFSSYLDSQQHFQQFKVPRWIEKNFYKTWGLQFDQYGLVGFNKGEHKGISYGAMGCVVCHSGYAAGQLIIGLGNKNIDVTKMAGDVHRVEKMWWRLGKVAGRSPDFQEIEENAMTFSSYLADQRLGNLTQGLVPVSFIKGWFYRVEGESVPNTARGQVKVPHLWGYEKKREVGQFCDGFGDGEEVGWAVAVELAAGQSVDNIRHMYDEVVEAEELFNDFLPPKYPFSIDSEKAKLGRTIYENNCLSCHGDYKKDQRGFPVYEQPKRIQWSIVKTDFDRLAVVTPEFMKKVNSGPLADIMRYKHTSPGYFAPRLEGIWSRFPYLHNASVPNIMALLLPQELRPKVYSLEEAGSEKRFDKSKMGLTELDPSVEAKLLRQTKVKSRAVYDTRRSGHSSRGHDFSRHLTNPQRYQLIEYLKTL